MERPPLHHELRHHVDHLDFMLYSTQQEVDRAHANANLDHFALLQARGTIKLLAKERRHLRRQRQARNDTIGKLKAKVTELKDYISDFENHLEKVEEEGMTSARKKMPSLVMTRIILRTWTWKMMMMKMMMSSLMMRRKMQTWWTSTTSLRLQTFRSPI
jgi:cell division protein FtsB